MPPTLVALAGKSRSGKGTCVAVFEEEAFVQGLTIRERQLSGPGKQYVADAFRPGITEEEAIDWFEEMKQSSFPARIIVEALQGYPAEATLQEYLQRMLQGARDRWGDDFWTDKLLPMGFAEERVPRWYASFAELDVEADVSIMPSICLISDMRQNNEAWRVRDLGGLVIEVHRPEHDDPYVTSKAHITERGLDPALVDVHINSTGDIDLYRAMCQDVFRDHVLPRLEAAR